MADRIRKSLLLAFVLLLSAHMTFAQVSNSGTLLGTVTDATGAVIAGAEVKIKDDATGNTLETKSSGDGTFSFANLRPGTYTVTVSMTGFKTGEFRNVKIIVGNTSNLTAKMDVGEITSSVVVEAGAEVLQTQQTAIGTTISGRLITEIPFTSRDVLDLAVLDAGAQTTGNPRGTTFNGLPQGAINITLDGLNVQANDAKSSDGFFTMIRPRIDSIEEFSISTAAQGADQSGEGAVQIRFETKRGGNEFHGGAWWYHRNDFFNSNYYFNNLAGTPRQRMRLNQYGYNIGGPIWKDKVFFFHAFDFWKKPEALSQNRTILTTDATNGLFTYAVGAVPGTIPAWLTCNGGALTCTADLMAMAAANGVTASLDPTIQGYLTAMNSSVGVAGVGLAAAPSLFQRAITFNNASTGERWFPDFRFDYQVSKNHMVTAIYHYQDFNSTPDLLNGRGPTYPVAPFTDNISSQLSTRNAWSFAWRWNVGPTMSNEWRGGVQSVPSNFFSDQDPAFNPAFNTGLGTLLARPVLPGVITAPFLTYAPFTRNYAIAQMSDNLGWTRGKHTFNFGFSMTELRGGFEQRGAAAGTVTVGFSNNDPMNAVIGNATLPGIPTASQAAQLNNARNLFALLAGRVTGFTSTVFVNNETRQFTPGASRIDRVRQTEFGIYGTDSWRLSNTLTINYGLRWEYQGPGEDPDNLFYRVAGGYDGVWGVSGTNNLFQPGTTPGTPTTYELNNGQPWHNRDLNNFAPSLGLAWQPTFENKLWKLFFGEPGKTVLRGSYAITYTREGANNWITIGNGNPGSAGVIQAAASAAAGTGLFPAGTVQFSSFNVPNVFQTPASFGGPFAANPVVADPVNAFDPNLAIPTVQSWSFGIQRELTPNTVIEFRYVGNHGTGLWRQVNLNEVNIFENGFLQEFLNAQNNLAICRATAGCTPRFSNQGLAGQVNVPIFTSVFTGNSGGVQNHTNFGSAANIAFLDAGTVGAMAGAMNNLSGWQNLTAATNPATSQLYPQNFWMANPHARGGAFVMTNASHSTYNALQVEFRRRLSQGLQFNGNYTWSHSITNLFADSSINFLNYDTFRDPNRMKGPSPFDLRQAFKLQLIYEMPFGPGRRWSSGNGIINRAIEGWQISSITRWQSGRVFQVTGGGGGTFNTSDPGVELIGITANQLQDMLEVRKVPGTPGQVFLWPQSLLAANGSANPSFIRSCRTPGQMCQRLFLYGPQFFRGDISIIKKTKITERTNIEFRAEFLNAFNNINFLYGGAAGGSIATIATTSTQFGRITNAYQDVSTTDDPGGRIIQMVLRINF